MRSSFISCIITGACLGMRREDLCDSQRLVVDTCRGTQLSVALFTRSMACL